MRNNKICFLIVFLFMSMMFTSVIPADDEQRPEIPGSNVTVVSTLNPYIYGTCRLFFTRGLYWGIENIGEATVENVFGSFQVTGGFDKSITFTDSYTFESIEPGYVSGRFWTKPISGFGPLTLSLDVTASNVEPLSISVPGFQVGFRTFVFFAPWRGNLF